MRDTITEGNYAKYGVQEQSEGLVFTFEAEKEDECKILFYGKNQNIIETIEVPSDYCKGAVRSVSVKGLSAKNLRYNYEINGTIVTDPYANRIIGREKWNDRGRENCNYQICGGHFSQEFDWREDKCPEVSRRQMVIYKLHVRGFSMDMGKQGKGKGTFRAIREHIPYFKEMGITTLEFMPIYEFEEQVLSEPLRVPEYLHWQVEDGDIVKPSQITSDGKVNYWGYVQGNYFAVKSSYADTSDEMHEWKELVRELHANGMECIMEMFFPKTQNQSVVMDALHYWVRECHVDGFHLLGENLPIALITQDAWLKRTKIFYAEFNQELFKNGAKYPHLFTYSDEYLYPVRAMLNHMNSNLDAFVCQQRKQHKIHGFVNYIADNNGFSLLDIFCYSEKHNEANGEANVDGTNWNLSSNYGIEGKTAKKHVNAMREQQLRNAITILMLGQGVPLLFMGDEMGNSQEGNNNAYCQDNSIGWVNWKKTEKNRWLRAFVTNMIAFRKEHPVVASEEPKCLSDYGRKGVPDLSYHGENAWISAFTENQQAVGVMYCGAYEKRVNGSLDDMIYVGYNFHVCTGRLALPKLPDKRKWYLCMDTSRGREPFLEKEEVQKEMQIEVNGQSVVILVGK